MQLSVKSQASSSNTRECGREKERTGNGQSKKNKVRDKNETLKQISLNFKGSVVNILKNYLSKNWKI